MRLCRFTHADTPLVGALVGDSVVDLAAAGRELGHALPDVDGLRGLVEVGPGGWDAVHALVDAVGDRLGSAWAWPLDRVTFHYPYRPRKNIVRAGGNLRRDGQAVPGLAVVTLPPGRWLRGYPLTYYTKAPTAVLDPGATIHWPSTVTRQVHAEPQLVIVIGEPISYAEPDEALAKVFGYSVATDLTAYDLKLKHGQWPKAGSLDSFFPWGPALVTSDEVPNPGALSVRLELNGETLIEASTSDALMSVGEILAELSTGIRLEPGDVLMLGVPECVGFGQDPARWLGAGDVISSSIEGVGSITNSVHPNA